MTDFEKFKSEFRKWQVRFGLTGYNICFKNEVVDGGYADIFVDQTQRVVTVRFNPDKTYKKSSRTVAEIAKHEAIHLLIHNLQACAEFRYVIQDEIYEAGEALVYKLEGLIGGTWK